MNPLSNHLPLTWKRNEHGSLVAEVCADNIVLLNLYVHPPSTHGHMYWLEGLSCGAGNSSETEEQGKRDAIELAIQALDAARETLVAAREQSE